ncbi:MAG: DoxX family protein [Myxococcota bacterium]
MTETRKGYLWGGRILTALPILMLVMSATMKLTQNADFMKSWGTFGFKPEQALTVGLIELLCVALYAIPQTAVLGAVLATGYLGGAVVTHLRVGEAPFAPVLIGVIVWGGLFLRDERVRALLPFRKA